MLPAGIVFYIIVVQGVNWMDHHLCKFDKNIMGLVMIDIILHNISMLTKKISKNALN